MVSKPVLCLAGPGRRGEVCHPQPCPAGLAAHSLLGSGLEEFHVELQRTPVLLALLTFLAPHATVTLYWSFKIWVKTHFFLHLTGTDKGFYCQKQKEKKKPNTKTKETKQKQSGLAPSTPNKSKEVGGPRATGFCSLLGVDWSTLHLQPLCFALALVTSGLKWLLAGASFTRRP